MPLVSKDFIIIIFCFIWKGISLYWFVTLFSSMFDINSLQQSIETKLTIGKDLGNLEKDRSDIDPICTQNEDRKVHNTMETDSLISFEKVEMPAPIEIVRQPSPPPVLAEVQDLIPAMSPQVPEVECTRDTSLSDKFVHPEASLQLHIVSYWPLFVVSFYMPILFSSNGNRWQIMKRAVRNHSKACLLFVKLCVYERYFIL